MQHEPIILPGGDIALIGLAFSPDGRYVAVGDFAGNITVLMPTQVTRSVANYRRTNGWAFEFGLAPRQQDLGFRWHGWLYSTLGKLPSQCIVEIEPPGEKDSRP